MPFPSTLALPLSLSAVPITPLTSPNYSFSYLTPSQSFHFSVEWSTSTTGQYPDDVDQKKNSKTYRPAKRKISRAHVPVVPALSGHPNPNFSQPIRVH